MGPSSLQASCKLFGNYANYSFWGIYLVALPGLEPGLFALRVRFSGLQWVASKRIEATKFIKYVYLR